MNTQPPAALNIPALLKRYGIHPQKKLGQNFLVDERILRMIIIHADLHPDDHVLEIGPGLGSLTRHLSRVVRSITAVELDQELIPVLSAVLAPFPNVRLVQGDILKLDPIDLIGETSYQVVANIPYNITSAIIRHLLEARSGPKRIVLTVQKEVAERICASPGAMSLLALSVQVYGKPSIVLDVPSTAFYPSPKVDSSVILIDLYPQPLIPRSSLDKFFKLAKAGFTQKRKTIRNSLSSVLGRDQVIALLASSGIDPMRRAETLSLYEWKKLCE